MITDLTKESRMAELIDILNDAARKYYAPQNDEVSLVSDTQYDTYLSELMHLEEETGIKLKGSPSMKVGFVEPEDGKIKHHIPILSLKSTKNVDDMLRFLGEEEGVLSWKLDGLSIILYYSFGNLRQAVSRGDGYYGRDITKNVMQIRRVPKTISIKNNLIIRGEGCMTEKDFNLLKDTKWGEKYKTPRNLASGLICSSRTDTEMLKYVTFVAHTAVLLDGFGRTLDTRYEQLAYLHGLGFKVVPHTKVLNFELKSEIDKYTKNASDFEYPTDGLVLSIDDLIRGEALGCTTRYPRHTLAYKWSEDI